MTKYSDYRFDFIAYGLRKTNPDFYAFSKKASRLLAENDDTSTIYGDEMWEEFWEDLVMQHKYGESR